MQCLFEKIFFKQNIPHAASKLELKLPYAKGLVAAILILLLLFVFYPIITQVTGYTFRIPPDWISLGAGVFISHGIGEELIFRGFLFRHIRESVNSFWKAALLSVPFFAAAHVPIIISKGMLVGGTAFLLAVASSFPLAYLFERSGNSIIPPAIVHFAIDTIIPILSFAGANPESQIPTVYWMLVSMVIPYLAFVILREKQKRNMT